MYNPEEIIVINGITIKPTPNALHEGLWYDLVEVQRAANIPDKRTFSEWRSRQSRALRDAGQVSFDYVRNTTCGTRAAVLAYIMWADLSMWLAVVNGHPSRAMSGLTGDRFNSLRPTQASTQAAGHMYDQ